VYLQRRAFLFIRTIYLEIAYCDVTEVFGPLDPDDPVEREVRSAQKRSAFAAPKVDESEFAVIDREVF
jgi:hypothetical protein